ncbi:MAG: hypothetical protein AAGJ51_11990, partial [Pseudomonadota bacterium]
MPTGLLERVHRSVLPTQHSYSAAGNTLETPANDTIDVNSARLPSRRIGLSRASLRKLFKLLDYGLSTAIVAGFLILSGIGILSATVSQILPFALIPVVAT